MPLTPHIEHHFTARVTMWDVVIGMADRLKFILALAGKRSSAAVATRVVVTAGIAELSTGAIAIRPGRFRRLHHRPGYRLNQG